MPALLWPPPAAAPPARPPLPIPPTLGRALCRPSTTGRGSVGADKNRRHRGATTVAARRARGADADVFMGGPDAPELGGRLVQWYPGHIARAERRLKEALARVDVVIEVRDARAPGASAHPSLPRWAGSKPRVLVINRVDQVSAADKAEWDAALTAAGTPALWTDGKRGAGARALATAAAAAADAANASRARRGLAPRAARAVVVGLPNVGKSALINRLLGRAVAPSAPRPGVTRDLRWCRVADGAVDLLDAPGVMPPRLDDQVGAAKLAACNLIGDAAYLSSAVAAALVDTLASLPRGEAAVVKLARRLNLNRDAWATGEDAVDCAAAALFQGDVERAGARILKDYRSGALGDLALEDARGWG